MPGVISEGPDIVRAGIRDTIRVRPNTISFSAIGVNPISKKYSAYNVNVRGTVRFYLHRFSYRATGFIRVEFFPYRGTLSL
jgi:hypothetical protein